MTNNLTIIQINSIESNINKSRKKHSELIEIGENIKLHLYNQLIPIWNNYNLMTDDNGVILASIESDDIINRKDIESIISSHVINIELIEYSILGGFYIGASALIRQEIEGLAHLINREESYNDKRNTTKAPNISKLESIQKKIYSHLSGLTHLSNQNLIQEYQTTHCPYDNILILPMQFSLKPEYNYGICDDLLLIHFYIMICVQYRLFLYIKKHNLFMVESNDLSLITNKILNYLPPHADNKELLISLKNLISLTSKNE